MCLVVYTNYKPKLINTKTHFVTFDETNNLLEDGATKIEINPTSKRRISH